MAISDVFSGLRKTLPVLLQAESAECGLACLTMVANYLGHEVDLSAMRRRFPTSARGATLSRIIVDAHSLGLDSRPLRVELEHIPQLQVPCILHWNMNHFVVLKKATATRVEIHDPAGGYRTLSMAEVSKHFTGIALELQPSVNFQPVKEKQRISLRALTGNLRGFTGAAVQVLMLALGLEIFSLIVPLFMQTVLDQVLVANDTRLLTLLGISFLFIVALRAGLSIARGWAISWLGGRLSAQWISNLFNHLLRLPMAYYEKRHVGDLTSRFNSVQTIQQTLTGSFVESILDGGMGIIALVVLCLYSASLTGVVMLGFVIYMICRWVAYRKLWEANEEQIVYAARQQTSLLEAIRGVQSLKLANKQSDRAARFANITAHATQRFVAVQRITFAFTSINQCLFGALRIAIIWIAANQVLAGKFSIGMLVAFIAYADELTTRFSNLIDKFVAFRMLDLHAERIADIALTPPEELSPGNPSVAETNCEIVVDDVSFRYAESEPWILKKCSFRVGAGESVAITGPSGCGKTTLAKLLLGLLEPTEGAIRIDGVDIRQFGIAAYRDLIGAVMQDDELFGGSIADNISFFDDTALPAKIEEAANKAAILDQIKAMPMGYETLIGDMGSVLSGGQKQRILLARAFFREPKILVLDEATSHLDIERERIINERIKRTEVTRIILAHRPETIASADSIFAIEDAQVHRVDSVRRLDEIKNSSIKDYCYG